MLVSGICQCCNMLKEELDEACRIIVQAEGILAMVNRNELKLYEGFFVFL